MLPFREHSSLDPWFSSWKSCEKDNDVSLGLRYLRGDQASLLRSCRCGERRLRSLDHEATDPPRPLSK
jgi:hypothetical protein